MTIPEFLRQHGITIDEDPTTGPYTIFALRQGAISLGNVIYNNNARHVSGYPSGLPRGFTGAIPGFMEQFVVPFVSLLDTTEGNYLSEHFDEVREAVERVRKATNSR